MDFIKKNIAIVAFLAGLVIGLIYAYQINPVVWVDQPPSWLAPQYKDQFIRTTAVAFASDRNPQTVLSTFAGWENAYGDICTARSTTQDPGLANVYNEMAKLLNNGQECGATAVDPSATSPTTEEASGNSFVMLLLVLILIALVAGIFYILNKRRGLVDDTAPSTYYDMPESGPLSDEEVSATPLARFPSSYGYGRDNFDDSHAIENTNGDFLGECGISIAETIGTDSPKSVAAFEVWLFDKNDIRTVTKVIMSDHAYFDDAIKAKLAPKGEPVLARENEVIVLETAALIINAEVKEMQYGQSGNLPPQSYFESLVIELSVWSKNGAAAASPAQADDLLDY